MASAARWSPGSTRAPSAPIENVIAWGPLLGASGNSSTTRTVAAVGADAGRARRSPALSFSPSNHSAERNSATY